MTKKIKPSRAAIESRIEKLAAMTVARGATPYEAAVAANKLARALGTLEGLNKEALDRIRKLYRNALDQIRRARAGATGLALDRSYYNEWRLRLLQIAPDFYDADSPIPSNTVSTVSEFLSKIESQNRRAFRYLSPHKRKRLDALAAKLDAGYRTRIQAKYILMQAWSILAPFALTWNKRQRFYKPRDHIAPKPTLYVDVTERALIQRINRALPDSQQVKIGRGKTAARGAFFDRCSVSMRNPTQGGQGFRRKADSNPMIADSG